MLLKWSVWSQLRIFLCLSWSTHVAFVCHERMKTVTGRGCWNGDRCCCLILVFLCNFISMIGCWWRCSPKHMIYYKRELLCRSLDGRRVDLITVSDCRGISNEEEPRFDSRLFPDTSTRRCRMFSGKKVCYVVMFCCFGNLTFSCHVDLPSVLWRCWLGGRKGIRPVKNWVVGCWRGYLGWDADLHIAQQMPLPLTISCSSKFRLVLTFLVLPFWYLLTRVIPDIFQKSSKMVVCVCVCSHVMEVRPNGNSIVHINKVTLSQNITTSSFYWCFEYLYLGCFKGAVRVRTCWEFYMAYHECDIPLSSVFCCRAGSGYPNGYPVLGNSRGGFLLPSSRFVITYCDQSFPSPWHCLSAAPSWCYPLVHSWGRSPIHNLGTRVVAVVPQCQSLTSADPTYHNGTTDGASDACCGIAFVLCWRWAASQPAAWLWILSKHLMLNCQLAKHWLWLCYIFLKLHRPVLIVWMYYQHRPLIKDIFLYGLQTSCPEHPQTSLLRL